VVLKPSLNSRSNHTILAHLSLVTQSLLEFTISQPVARLQLIRQWPGYNWCATTLTISKAQLICWWYSGYNLAPLLQYVHCDLQTFVLQTLCPANYLLNFVNLAAAMFILGHTWSQFIRWTSLSNSLDIRGGMGGGIWCIHANIHGVPIYYPCILLLL
jgi:hypothetical protein